MAKGKRVLDFYASKSWAILEENLQEMFEIYKAAIERTALDKEFDPEAVSAKLGRPLDNARTVTTRDGIAILPVVGPLMRYANIFTQISGATSIEMLALEFNQALSDRTVKGIVLEINSPGGEVDGTSELAQMIFNARGQDKPIVAYVGHLGASAAYWLASACDEIVCADTASLGSIGVVGGVRTSKDKGLIEFVSSQSPNKRPDPQTESGRAQFQAHVDALADVFIETVARNRDMTAEEVVSGGGSGGMKVGRLAVEAGLADRVGTLEETISELATTGKPRQRMKNVNASAVVNLHAGGQPPKPTIGAETMPEKENKPADATEKVEKPDAKTDVKTAAESKPGFPGTFVAGEVVTLEAELSEAKTKAAATEAKLTETETALKATQEENKKATARIDALEKKDRATRFGALAKDWPGETAGHIAMLEFLSTSAEKGEESDLFKAYVTQQNAATEQIKTVGLFSEIGSSVPVAGSAAAEIEGKAKKLVEDSAGKMTYQQAYDQIYSTNSALRNRLTEEDRRQTN